MLNTSSNLAASPLDPSPFSPPTSEKLPQPSRRLQNQGVVMSEQVADSKKSPSKLVKFDTPVKNDNDIFRNYYRCTSAGCPVRKHIETSVENTSALILTYKGVHDHDMPVPKKRQGPPNAHLIAASSTASMANAQLKSCNTLQRSTDTEGGGLTELGGEKVMESARTLLSIGFEIKP